MTQQRAAQRRNEILRACLELLLEVGAETLTHRMIADRADVPLGSTTYYFASLNDLIEEALELGARDSRDALDDLEKRLAQEQDIAAVLTSTLHGYLADREQLRFWGELYTVASHRPELRPLASLWKDGLVRVLSQHMSEDSARAAAIVIDGVQLHALIDEEMPKEDDLKRFFQLIIQEDDGM